MSQLVTPAYHFLSNMERTSPSLMAEEQVRSHLQLDTSGGAYVAGNVAAHEFIGRDKISGYTAEQVAALLEDMRRNFQPRPFEGHSPYVGLRAFTEQDAEYFFGRTQLVTNLLARVDVSRFVVVAGPSGSGKSSLVRAGLLPALKVGKLLNSERWLYETLTPGRDPMTELARVTSSLADSTNAGNELMSRGISDATLLHRWVEIALKDDRRRRAILVVDQFEEIFTQLARADIRIAFLNLLTYAATVERGRTTILFTLRSDFVTHCASYPQINALLNQQFLQMGPMQPGELVQAIAQPAVQVGLRIDPDLVAQIVNEMQGEPGSLPLMQFALTDLFDSQQRKGGVIALTLADYQARGGLHKALERHADAGLAKLLEPDRQLAGQIFKNLIQVGHGTQDTRRTALFAEIVPVGCTDESVQSVMQKLADSRLLTTDGQGDQQTVTIAHEKLIDAWPWLRNLVNEHREMIALQNQINEDAQAWHNHQKDTSYLYQGARLATIQEQMNAKKLVLSKASQEFINVSIAQRDQGEKERQRRVRLMTALLTIVGVLLIPTILVMANIWMFSLRQSSAWQLTNFPSVAVKSIAIANARKDSTAPLICVGTTDIGVGCSINGHEWNIYQAGFPTSYSYILNDRNTWWGSLIGSNWETNLVPVESLNFDATDPIEIAAVVQDTGIFRSHDGGAHWQMIEYPPDLSLSPPVTQVYKLTFHHNYIQLLLNKGIYSPLPENLRGSLFASADSGTTWQLVGGPTTETGQIRDIYLETDGENQARLYAAAANGLFSSDLAVQWRWRREVGTDDEDEMWLIARSPTSYYLATFVQEKKEGTIYRWNPTAPSTLEHLVSYKGVLKALAADPDPESDQPLWLLFGDNRINSICKSGTFIDRGSRPGWFWSSAHDLNVLRDENGELRVLVGHSDGLLQYRFQTNTAMECMNQ